ncbi:hypothetical protein [Saccharopolyspora hattusasensis]|uniref:hypothetical protein n=1 Tax=Saccharopolyspora hattusasensis TaxID=1128679 RepID=UPI003D96E0CA
MQLPHTITLIIPAEVADAYSNPVSQLDYRRGSRRAVLALMQPMPSHDAAEPGRKAVVSRWRLFTFADIPPQARVEWRGRVFDIEGEPQVWEPRRGRRHVEAFLRVVEGRNHGASSAV